ncbi:hypothetical protein FOZ62_028832, partial [Perkinsus olseni]
PTRLNYRVLGGDIGRAGNEGGSLNTNHETSSVLGDVSMHQEWDSDDYIEIPTARIVKMKCPYPAYMDILCSGPEHSVHVSPIEAQSPPFIATSDLWSPEQSSCSYRVS